MTVIIGFQVDFFSLYIIKQLICSFSLKNLKLLLIRQVLLLYLVICVKPHGLDERWRLLKKVQYNLDFPTHTALVFFAVPFFFANIHCFVSSSFIKLYLGKKNSLDFYIFIYLHINIIFNLPYSSRTIPHRTLNNNK